MKRNCRQCQSPFEISRDDLLFYEKISPTYDGQIFHVPPPTQCPECRMQRRMAWRGELHLFRRKSDFSGKETLTFYPPSAQCKVYTRDEWWSDDWNTLSYGRDFDFQRPFFEQFQDLVQTVPLIALSCQGGQDNSDFTNCASWNRNCYLISGANYNEDCYYGNYINHSKNCVDNNFVTNCELCYECVDCTGCYRTQYSSNSHNCSDSFFLQNCRGCRNCFGCVNLLNKEHYFYNEPLTKESYFEKIASLSLNKRSSIEKCAQTFEAFRLKFPFRFMMGDLNENVSGNSVSNSRNSSYCFDATGVEDCKHCTWFHQSKNCMDVIAWGFPAELCYECTEAGDNSYGVRWSISTYGSQEILYSYYTMYSKHCFGCVGARKNEYCILNKQYTKDAYEKLVARIVTHMISTGEWGEFFPVKISPLPYNTAICQDYFPLSREEVLSLGWRWHEFESPPLNPASSYAVPEDINDISADICEKLLSCTQSKKSYKIIKAEFEFHKKNGIPIPDKCFQARHEARLARRNPRQLWDRNCKKCGSAILTSYPPYRPEIVYCEGCFADALV